MEIFDILEELASDNSRIFKESVLKREQNNDVLKRVFQLALDPNINFWIKKIPGYQLGKKPVWALQEAFVQLNALINREVTGNAAIDHLSEVLSNLDAKDAKVVERIIGRDLRCGVNDATVNKIWKNLIPEFNVMLADKKVANIKFPAICQTKMDGIRCHLTLQGDELIAFSRQGKPIDTKGKLFAQAIKFMKEGETWDGELVCFKDGKPLDRKASNGILNKAIRGTISEEEADLITFTAWDIIDDVNTYQKRFDLLTARFMYPNDKFRLVHSVVVNSAEDADVEFAKALEAGEEGVILKNFHGKWEGKRSKNLCKLKAEETADLRVVRWEKGTGKNANRLGNLICQTEDGLLEVSVGTGFSDEDRDALTPENTVGRVLEVMYNMVIKAKTKDAKHCLYLPRAIRFRDGEKTVANTLEEIL